MRRFNNLSIRARLYAGTAFALLLLTLLGGLGLWAVNDARSTLQGLLEQKVQAIVDTGQLRTTLGDLQRFEKEVIIAANNANEAADWRKSWQKSMDTLRKGLAEAARKAGMGGDAQNATAQGVAAVLKNLKDYEDSIAPVLEKIEQAQIDIAAAGAYAGQAQEFALAADKAMAALALNARQDLHAAQAAMAARAGLMLAVIGGGLGLALLVLVPLTIRSVRGITQALTRAQALAERIAQGDLSTDDGPEPHKPGAADAAGATGDEVARLVQAMVGMRSALQGMVQRVRAASRSISGASGEIAAGNQDLSQRTEQAAANLQQTAASMEQLTDTVRQSADAAAQANQLASGASEVALRGGRIVTEVVSTMDEINAASRKIADIVGVVDSIAFQTNILALNAAVEAARAGEQGRGFAVVASEVRSLAQRSGEAAREIKALIGASVGKVESGSRLVQDAGSTMTEIVSSVQRVAQTIAGISAAAVDQSQGIGQVGSAVTQLDQMTQQNAALVEQSAAAAASLDQQAQQLAGVVAAFRLSDAAA